MDISKVQRGDVLYYKSDYDLDGTLGICLGAVTMFNWHDGINLVKNNECKYAWRIE